jgi:hypothetical protein
MTLQEFNRHCLNLIKSSVKMNHDEINHNIEIIGKKYHLVEPKDREVASKIFLNTIVKIGAND